MAGRCLAIVGCTCFVPGVLLFVNFRDRKATGKALDPSLDFKIMEGQCEVVDSGWQEETRHTIQTLTYQDDNYDEKCDPLTDDTCNQVNWYSCTDTYIYGFRVGKNSAHPSTVVFNSRPVTLARTEKGKDEALHACHGTSYAAGKLAKGPIVEDPVTDCWQPSHAFSKEQREAYECANEPCFKLSDPVEEFAEYKNLNNIIFVMSAFCFGCGILMFFAAWVSCRKRRKGGGGGSASHEDSDEDLLHSKKSRIRNYDEEEASSE